MKYEMDEKKKIHLGFIIFVKTQMKVNIESEGLKGTTLKNFH